MADKVQKNGGIGNHGAAAGKISGIPFPVCVGKIIAAYGVQGFFHLFLPVSFVNIFQYKTDTRQSQHAQIQAYTSAVFLQGIHFFRQKTGQTEKQITKRFFHGLSVGFLFGCPVQLVIKIQDTRRAAVEIDHGQLCKGIVIFFSSPGSPVNALRGSFYMCGKVVLCLSYRLQVFFRRCRYVHAVWLDAFLFINHLLFHASTSPFCLPNTLFSRGVLVLDKSAA